MLVLETNVNAYGPADFDRCRLLRVDASTLTCTALDGKTHLTFPANRLDAVYKVRQSWVSPILGSIALGCFLGGIASGNAPAVIVGLIAAIIWGATNVHSLFNPWDNAGPLPANEHRELLYLRP